ncbi:hypothetical protein H4R18_001531 [Coemansia javaensis]|uniref:Uncharacterized protein n=1 Tax=Coemansia javaensis TaxID=2761396 RepID=A0A9W8HET3_9FUNG|nr:hypothetical protein H4R18_001531 [Coemansia javaensis]
MGCDCHPHNHFCQPAVPAACWFLVHDRKEPCGCGGASCDKYRALMAKLILCGFDPHVPEDVMFLRNLVVSEAGDGDKTVAMFAKWKSGFNAKWEFAN